MGYCMLCEETWLGWVSGGNFCSQCSTLQTIVKAFGKKKTINAIKIKIGRDEYSVKPQYYR